ncbi:hypothetical protein [Listeria phage LMTA-57]|uniref:Uncharacterized protein n=3 Tax=Pecentumvirus TaxID=1857844 RepID=A0A060AGH4_9CAUD|nr:hypothetical protein HH39_gp182 [Listeria phage LMSP-25]YP_009616194.1 hypothetical protein FDI77_gp182 [Listeria phage LMTA-34]YP_009793454.1 hypothetical protein QLX42_gp151 [Listeria phage LMTA-57]AIA64434.1 hypothetical protein [Listeria phage LMSP-25]AID16992.1 hypothetical protein [Listeria phage LMTA-34]AID17605.1 hypothetical protein [Listeria phage LMTA-57]
MARRQTVLELKTIAGDVFYLFSEDVFGTVTDPSTKLNSAVRGSELPFVKVRTTKALDGEEVYVNASLVVSYEKKFLDV